MGGCSGGFRQPPPVPGWTVRDISQVGATWNSDGQSLQSKTPLRKFSGTGVSMGQLEPTGGCVLLATIPSCLPQGWC